MSLERKFNQNKNVLIDSEELGFVKLLEILESYLEVESSDTSPYLIYEDVKVIL